MRKGWMMVVAVTGNAIGQSLMAVTDIGMTAWGTSAVNFSAFFNISLGLGFLIVSTVFYILAIIIRKEFQWKEVLLSYAFLVSFSFLVDLCISLLPDLTTIHYGLRVLINAVGLLILLFAIGTHIKLNIALHPMDIFLRVIQKKFNSIKIGTYIAYFTAFVCAIVFGVLDGEISGFGIGTINTLLFGGIILDFYDRYIISKYFIYENSEKSVLKSKE